MELIDDPKNQANYTSPSPRYHSTRTPHHKCSHRRTTTPLSHVSSQTNTPPHIQPHPATSPSLFHATYPPSTLPRTWLHQHAYTLPSHALYLTLNRLHKYPHPHALISLIHELYPLSIVLYNETHPAISNLRIHHAFLNLHYPVQIAPFSRVIEGRSLRVGQFNVCQIRAFESVRDQTWPDGSRFIITNHPGCFVKLITDAQHLKNSNPFLVLIDVRPHRQPGFQDHLLIPY